VAEAVNVKREDFQLVRRPAKFTTGHVHAVENLGGESPNWSRHTLCGLLWDREWPGVFPEEMSTEKLCGVCDKGIRKRIREAEEATAIARIRGAAGDQASLLLADLLAETDRTIGGIQMARMGLDYCLRGLDGVRGDLLKLLRSADGEEEGGNSPVEEQPT